jgi:triosephosphate isomerase (TIM)
MRTRLVVGNWKMHKTVREAHDLATALRKLLDGVEGADVVVCPPFTALAEVGKVLAGSRIELGAQDLHWEPKGAYTGEVSAPMLWDLGCLYAIVGHSERRRLLGEGDETIRRKLNAALTNELVPILCVGESKEERDAGRTERIVQTQLRIATMDVPPESAAQLVVAYEPVWAIGSGTPATGAEANRVAQLLRGWLNEWFAGAGASIRILYGGSVTPETIGEFASQAEIDGALVGGASLDADAFAPIVKAFDGR